MNQKLKKAIIITTVCLLMTGCAIFNSGNTDYQGPITDSNTNTVVTPSWTNQVIRTNEISHSK